MSNGNTEIGYSELIGEPYSEAAHECEHCSATDRLKRVTDPTDGTSQLLCEAHVIEWFTEMGYLFFNNPDYANLIFALKQPKPSLHPVMASALSGFVPAGLLGKAVA